MQRINDVSETIGKNVKDLRIRAGLSIEGFAAAIGISISYVRMIEKGTANITTKMATRIAEFFEIDIQKMYSTSLIKSKKVSLIIPVRKFYEENKRNPQFFIQRKGEDSVAHFLKHILIPSGFFSDKREVNEVKTHAKLEFKRDFNSKELSRELNRLVESGKLIKTDKTGNKSIYLFQTI